MLKLEYLAELVETNREALSATVKEFSLDGRVFAFNTRPALMGVVNLSADSWYRESVCLSTEQAVQQALVLTAQGADLVDVGAESTLAQAARVDAAGQTSRLLPVIAALRQANVLVSAETYQPAVARACLEAGAKVLNLTGSDHGNEIYRMAADHAAAVIICYVQGPNVREVGDFDFGADPVAGMSGFFARQIEAAAEQGVERILIDPGLGFYYRNVEDGAGGSAGMTVFFGSFRLRSLGVPICRALPHAFEFFGEEVRCAEPFFAVLAALGRTDALRTHEVARTKAVLETLQVF